MKSSLLKTVRRKKENVNRIQCAVAQIPTPIFNTPDIPFNSIPLKKDNQGRLMEMETIALPGTLFNCVEEISDSVVQVETNEYPTFFPLYVDRRFLKPVSKEIERKKTLPSSQKILQSLEGSIGNRYFWGGNWQAGIPQMLEFYPLLKKAAREDRDDARCRGLDCSGLLYEATDGIAPRNTSDLINYGQDLKLQGLPLDQIQAQLRPLDLLAWKGHVMIVRSPTTLIESRIKKGVVAVDFEERYREVVDLLKEQNKPLYFRRWHPDALPPQ